MDEFKGSLQSQISPEAFRKIIQNFDVFSVICENDVIYLRSIQNDRLKVRLHILNELRLSEESVKDITKLEILCMLSDFVLSEDFEVYEICCLFYITRQILDVSFRKNSKDDIFQKFKNLVVKFSMDRPPFQVGIIKKDNLPKISDFFIETFYKKFELLRFLTTEKKMIELNNTELFSISMPQTLSLDLGEEILPRQCKALKQYFEKKKPKSELEQKIDIVLDFERERLDKILEERFKEQDDNFNKTVDSLMAKKKR